jgi:hypothetical protein
MSNSTFFQVINRVDGYQIVAMMVCITLATMIWCNNPPSPYTRSRAYESRGRCQAEIDNSLNDVFIASSLSCFEIGGAVVAMAYCRLDVQWRQQFCYGNRGAVLDRISRISFSSEGGTPHQSVIPYDCQLRGLQGPCEKYVSSCFRGWRSAMVGFHCKIPRFC